MEIFSTAFDSGEEIPKKYTCDGKDLSPPLKISDIPSEAETLAIVVDDPDAPGRVFDHWLIWNIPVGVDSLPEGVSACGRLEELGGAVQGSNDFGEIGYRGPCPPGGPAHNYHFKLYALETKLSLDAGSSKEDCESAMADDIIDQAELIGRYGR